MGYFLSKLIILFIQTYQRIIAPLLPPDTCRFYPTCSSYAIEAIRKHGTGGGIMLTVKRILRCHPFNPGGYDPVP